MSTMRSVLVPLSLLALVAPGAPIEGSSRMTRPASNPDEPTCDDYVPAEPLDWSGMAWACGFAWSEPLPRVQRHPLQGKGRNWGAHASAKAERRRQRKQRARRRGW